MRRLLSALLTTLVAGLYAGWCFFIVLSFLTDFLTIPATRSWFLGGLLIIYVIGVFTVQYKLRHARAL